MAWERRESGGSKMNLRAVFVGAVACSALVGATSASAAVYYVAYDGFVQSSMDELGLLGPEGRQGQQFRAVFHVDTSKGTPNPRDHFRSIGGMGPDSPIISAVITMGEFSAELAGPTPPDFLSAGAEGRGDLTAYYEAYYGQGVCSDPFLGQFCGARLEHSARQDLVESTHNDQGQRVGYSYALKGISFYAQHVFGDRMPLDGVPISFPDPIGTQGYSTGSVVFQSGSGVIDPVTGRTVVSTLKTTEIFYHVRNVSVSTDGVPPEWQRPIPEPGTWALMILGFGSVGGALRRRRVLLPN